MLDFCGIYHSVSHQQHIQKEEKKEGKIGYCLIYDEYGNSKDKIGQPKTNAPRFHKKAQ